MTQKKYSPSRVEFDINHIYYHDPDLLSERIIEYVKLFEMKKWIENCKCDDSSNPNTVTYAISSSSSNGIYENF